MKSVSSLVVVLLLAVSGLLTTASGQGAKGQAKDKDADDKDARARNVNVINTPNVNVVNTPSVNVATIPPVTGSVAVTNTPTVNVGNTANVNVANSPNVKVSNDATAPVPTSRIDDPGRIPYHRQLGCEANCNGFVDFGIVPSGHRVVIQHVSVLAALHFDQNPNPPVGPGGITVVPAIVLLQGSRGIHSAFVVPPESAISPFGAVDQAVQAYFDESENILVSFLAGPNSAIVSVSGYQLDCAAAPCAPIAP
jgi:hypothetical protein